MKTITKTKKVKTQKGGDDFYTFKELFNALSLKISQDNRPPKSPFYTIEYKYAEQAKFIKFDPQGEDLVLNSLTDQKKQDLQGLAQMARTIISTTVSLKTSKDIGTSIILRAIDSTKSTAIVVPFKIDTQFEYLVGGKEPAIVVYVQKIKGTRVFFEENNGVIHTCNYIKTSGNEYHLKCFDVLSKKEYLEKQGL